MGSGFNKKKKQMKALQEQFIQYQEQMQSAEYTGSAPNDLVTITLNGEQELKKISIKPECVNPDDIDGLEDLIYAAFQDAHVKAKESSQQQMTSMGPLGDTLGSFGSLGL